MAAQGVNVSRDLVWMLTNKHNAQMFKRPGISQRFTTDPLNPKGLQTFRNSGSVQSHALSVQADPSGKGVVLLRKDAKHAQRPAKSVTRISLKRGAARTMKSIKNVVNKTGHRKGLKTALLRRASAILLSQKKVAVKTPGKGKKD